MSEVLEAALRHASRRRAVFPCCPKTKRPLTARGFKDATTDSAVITAWFKNPDAMIGLPTGARTGLVVVDIDGDAGFESLRDLEHRHGALPNTASVETPRGGSHLYFRHPGVEVRCSASTIAPSVDIRGDGGYVISPPSKTADGRGYVVDEECDVADLPAWLLAATTEPTPLGAAAPASVWLPIVRDGVRGPDPLTGRPSEGRNDKLTRLVGHLMRHYIDAALAHEFAHLLNECRFYPPLPRDEVDRIVDSVAAMELRRRRAHDATRGRRVP
jgi:hypothetical protein